MRAKILLPQLSSDPTRPADAALSLASQLLRDGKVVGMPTETVYGLAGNAFDSLALTRIFETKERPTFDPLIVHVAPPEGGASPTIAWLEKLKLVNATLMSPKASEIAETLMRRFWPGPLTLVLPKLPTVPDLATSGLPTVAIRMPRHPVAQALVRAAGVPLAAPSANRFGRISPTSAQDVAQELGDRIELILDGGPCEVGLESTVLAISPDGEITQLRPGGVARQEIEKAIAGEVRLPATSTALAAPGIASPGMIESHYAPAKPLALLPRAISNLAPTDSDLPRIPANTSVGLLLMSGNARESSEKFAALTGAMVVDARVLSASGDLGEVARALFAGLRALDAGPAQILFSEPCPSAVDGSGLGHAIADRLKRASAKRPTETSA